MWSIHSESTVLVVPVFFKAIGYDIPIGRNANRHVDYPVAFDHWRYKRYITHALRPQQLQATCTPRDQPFSRLPAIQ